MLAFFFFFFLGGGVGVLLPLRLGVSPLSFFFLGGGGGCVRLSLAHQCQTISHTEWIILPGDHDFEDMYLARQLFVVVLSSNGGGPPKGTTFLSPLLKCLPFFPLCLHYIFIPLFQQLVPASKPSFTDGLQLRTLFCPNDRTAMPSIPPRHICRH